MSLVVTVGGGIFWKASQAVNRIDHHGRRIESLEKKANDNQAKLRESFDLMRKTLGERLPAPPRTQP